MNTLGRFILFPNKRKLQMAKQLCNTVDRDQNVSSHPQKPAHYSRSPADDLSWDLGLLNKMLNN